MPTELPKPPLPPELTSDEPGSWAYDTMSRRVRTDILARVFRENSFLPPIVERLQQLDAQLADAANTPLSLLSPDGGSDLSTWHDEILPPMLRDGLTWLSAPWVISEFYLYVTSFLLRQFRLPSRLIKSTQRVGCTPFHSATDFAWAAFERPF